jgi:CBS-domain-containing membrane protein
VTCAGIMTRNPVSIRETDTIGAAAKLIMENRYINLPVLDEEGRLAGLFGVYELLALLVPRVAVIGNLLPNLRFMGDNPAELREKYAAIRNNPVTRAVNRESIRVYPDTPLAEAIRLFCRNHTTLPVVERDSGVLVGMISYWDVLRFIDGNGV